MLQVYILTGGDVFYQIINGVAAFFGSSSWATLLRWALNIAVIMGFVRFIGTKDLLKLMKWVFIYVFVIGVLIVPKKSIQIIDLSDVTVTYKVDGVPVGIAGLFSLTTTIGLSVAKIYDDFFSLPDAVSYSKTGFLFGSTLARESLYINSQNPVLNENFNNYVASCVIGDIMINNKYSMNDLLQSKDILTLITNNASPIRRVIYLSSSGTKENVSCKEAASKLKTETASQFNNAGELIGSFAQIFYSSNGERNATLKALLQDSYSIFHNSSKTATDILKQNVATSAIKNGLSNYAGKQGDVGSLISLTAENSQLKTRLNWSVSAKIATTYLPLVHTVMLLLLFSLFPIVIMITISDVMGMQPLKLYALSLVYFMSWFPLYAVLNYIMVFYTKNAIGGVEPTLSNIDSIKQAHSDIGELAGYLSLSIPFLALGIVKGFSSVMTHASNFLNSSVTSPASQVSSSAADGNWNIGNLSTENVQGFKWDNNYSNSSGMMSQQLNNGAIRTMAPDGTMGYNTQGIQSHLATTGSYSSAVTSQYGESIRMAENNAVSAQQGFQESNRQTWSNLSQLQSSLNNSTSFSKGYNSDELNSLRQDVNEAMTVATQYAKNNNLSVGESINYLNYKSSLGSASAGVGARGSVGAKGGVAEGSIGADGRLSTAFTTGSQDNINHSSSDNTNHTRNDSSDLSQRWSMAMDKVSSYKLSFNGNQSDNVAQSYVDNISSSYERSIAESKAFNENQSIAMNLSKDMNQLTSNNTSVQSNLNNEFVDWVHKTNPSQAQTILSNTSDSAVAREREGYWQSFINENIQERIQSITNDTKADLQSNYSVQENHFKDRHSLSSDIDYNNQKTVLQNSAVSRGINSSEQVNNSIKNLENDYNLNKTVNDNVIDKRETKIEDEYSSRATEHQQERRTIKNISNYADDDQWFKDSNPIIETINEKDK